MTDKPVATIARPDLQKLETPASAHVTNVQHLSSYNWIEAPRSTPTIAIPGSPNLWSPPHVPFQLNKDSGHVYIAQNAARHPDSPLEPLLRAVYVSYPSFDIATVDVVTDRNNLRKLLGVVNNRWCSHKRENFTIHVEVTENTAVFCRMETKTEEFIGSNEFRGYGHSFEERCTSREISGSTGHHRIITYNFGGLKLVVRHETDGYIGFDGAQSGPAMTNVRTLGIDDLSNIMKSLALSPENSSLDEATAKSKLVIRREGRTVPLSETVEIKTRVAHRPLAFEDVVSQLWVSQTPKLVRAYHTSGKFLIPKVEDVVAKIKSWESENQRDLRVLVGLIRRIRDVVKECGGRAVLQYDANKDRLSFRRLRDGRLLPEDLYARWDKKSSDTESKAGRRSIKVADNAEAGKTPASSAIEA